MNVLIGSDPEVFLIRDGKIVPALGILPGSKEQPARTEHGWIQPDNALAEFNIAPAAGRDEFLRSIRAVMQDLAPYGQLAVQSSHEFTRAELMAAGPGVFQFGCDPDFNAWRGGERNPRPSARSVKGLRTAGGHIHVGCEVAVERRLDVVRGMDVLLGLRSVLDDDDTRRRNIYGAAGCYRPKGYGVEYRTLSNYWLRSDELVLWAYDTTIRVLEELDRLTEYCSVRGDSVQAAINTSNKDLAAHLLQEYEEAV